MAIYKPESEVQVEERMKVDVQREAPDSNPYLIAHWLRSVIAGFARRIFDLYRDLGRTEQRLFPDTADAETAARWGNIFIGPANTASGAAGVVVATGTAGSPIASGSAMTAGGVSYETTAAGTITAQALAISDIVSSDYTAFATTVDPHGLASEVPVTVTGSDVTVYNVTDVAIVVTGENSFSYPIDAPAAAADAGSPQAEFTTAALPVVSVTEGASTNLTLDTPLQLQAPIAGVDNVLYVSASGVSGGAAAESLPAYKARYLDKIRNPVAHFNDSDIIAKAKEVPGVTRVFVQRAGSAIGTVGVVNITRAGSVATVVTTTPHLLHSGNFTAIAGAPEPEYNVTNARVLVEDANTFHYLVAGTPASPATGVITAALSVPLGQLIVYFMRDNDADPIPTPAAVATTRAAIEEILPANTATGDLFVEAPVASVVDFVLTELVPNNASMLAAVDANLEQFFEERTSVGVTVDEDAYRAAIKNTVDPATGATVTSFDLVAPVGDIPVATNAIAVKGTVSL